MYAWSWHKFSATFESTSCQSRVARQSLSNLIQQSNLKEMLIQTSSYRRAKVELNWSIEFDRTTAPRLNWALLCDRWPSQNQQECLQIDRAFLLGLENMLLNERG